MLSEKDESFFRAAPSGYDQITLTVGNAKAIKTIFNSMFDRFVHIKKKNQVLFLAKQFVRSPGNFLLITRAQRKANALLISYPKSGRTWLRFLLASYFSSSYGLNMKIDLHNKFSILPNFDADPVRGIPSFLKKNWPPALPLILVSHSLHNPISFSRKRIIFMIRDPRDVMVSAYFHETRHKHRFVGGIAEFLADKTHGISALVHYLNVWARALENRDHITVSYEQLSREPEEAMKDILRFIRCPLDSAKIKSAIASAQFDVMRDLEVGQGIPGHEYDRVDSNSLRMRRGRPLGYVDYLSSHEIAFIDRYCSDNLTHAAKRLVHFTETPK